MLAYAPRRERRRLNAPALALIIGTHVVAIVAVMAAKMDVPVSWKPERTNVTFVPLPPEPKPDSPPQTDPRPSNQSLDSPIPIIDASPAPGPIVDVGHYRTPPMSSSKCVKRYRASWGPGPASGWYCTANAGASSRRNPSIV